MVALHLNRNRAQQGIPHMVCLLDKLLMMQSTSNQMMSQNMKLFEVISQLISAHMSALRITLCVCVRVCACGVCVCVVCVGHNYYGYPSDTRVDAVLYETIDPNKNSGEGMCAS